MKKLATLSPRPRPPRTWLVLDVHYLCHRAFHTVRNLSFEERPTGVLFGFLKSITYLKDEFATDRVAFCFEHPHLLRRDAFPAYKRHRTQQKRTPEEVRALEGLHLQIDQLRKRYLPQIGFRNVFCFDGYESDDTMAALARDHNPVDEMVLVTADNDLLQCITDRVSMYNPSRQKLFTAQWFRNHYGILPRQWALVKAIAGCDTDEVPGIRGVGEKTAIKYLTGQLKEGSAVHGKIVSSEGKKVVRRNRRLVQLPFEGCPSPSLRPDRISEKGWRETCAELGMRSLAGRPPIQTRKLGVHGR